MDIAARQLAKRALLSRAWACCWPTVGALHDGGDEPVVAHTTRPRHRMGEVAPALLVAGLLRLLFVLLGCYLDRLYVLGSSECSSGLGSISAALCAAEMYAGSLIGFKYTDIDYQVFSDAAAHIYNGQSPYESNTYRYPPIVALLLTSNSFVHSSCGKVIFCFFDVMALYFTYLIIKMESFTKGGVDDRRALVHAWISALNPLSIIICSRGSADSLSNSLVLLLILQLLRLKKSSSPSTTLQAVACAGATYAATVYIRIYPVIFLPCIAAYLHHILRSRMERRDADGFLYVDSSERGISDSNLAADSSLLVIINLAVFAASSAAVLASLMGLSFYVYGEEYVQNAVLYHFFRRDYKHNFSIHFYSNYLGLDSGDSGSSNNILAYVSKDFLLPLLPHIVSLCAVYKFASEKPVFCMFLQTIIFVAFNKVVTAQYFTWYATLLPLVAALDIDMNKLLRDGERKASLIFVTVLYLLSVLMWLYNAFCLEMLGQNIFAHVWASSLLFNVVNSFFIVEIVKTVKIVG